MVGKGLLAFLHDLAFAVLQPACLAWTVLYAALSAGFFFGSKTRHFPQTPYTSAWHPLQHRHTCLASTLTRRVVAVFGLRLQAWRSSRGWPL